MVRSGAAVPDADCIRFAAVSLGGPALRWWTTIPSADKPTTWDAMRIALRGRFQPVDAATDAQEKLFSLAQGKQSVNSYVESFTRLLAYLPDMAESTRFAFFVRGLQPAIATQLRVQGVTTLKAAIAMAARLDGLRSHPAGASSSSSSSPAAANAPMDLDALLMDGIEGLERDTDGADSSADADAPITQRQFQQLLNAMREQRSSSSPAASRGVPRPGRFQPRGPPRISHLSEEQVKEYMAAGKCFGCGSTEHSARACPKRKVGSDGRPSWGNSKPSN